MNRKFGIRFGNQTSFSCPRFDAPFDFAVQEGFSAFEFFPDKKDDGHGWSVSDIPVEERRVIKKKADDAGISLSLHLPWQANPLADDFNSIITDNIVFAGDIGAVIVVVHLYAENGVEAYVGAISSLIAGTGKLGISLAIENTPLTSPGDFNRLFGLLNGDAGTASDHVGMCLDIGHANLHESTRNDYLAYIDSLAPQVPVIHGHLHENYGDSDSHLTLFTGPSTDNSNGVSGVIERLVGRGFGGALIFEQWPEPPSLLSDAGRKLEKVISCFTESPVPAVKRVKTSRREDDLTAEFIALDKERRNWREKLDGVLELLDGEDVTDGHLSLAAIYLSFVGRGELALAEDGGHHRPCHHARTAKEVEKRLAELSTSENYFIIRKIYPWLPSHDKKFVSTEPLTRIRDIAHRNDIPRGLKDEIKHTLQNKLHRCAGPEDLVTSERILNRITARDASFSPSFVAGFIIFHKELQEFFNAESLTALLEKIAAEGYVPEVERTHAFISLKEKVGESDSGLLPLLVGLTGLRRLFFPRHWKKYDERAQKLRLADIALAGLSFVVSGRLNSTLSDESGVDLKERLPGLSLILENIELNRVYPDECRAVRREAESLAEGFSEKRRDDLLRLMANLERIIRIADDHAARLLSVFQKQAEELGRELHVSDSEVRFFSEGSIRADLIFQLSKYAYSMLRRVKSLLAMPEWETLFSGEAAGRLTEKAASGFASSYKEPVIIVADTVTGDEEIPPGVTGIILKKSIPLLSHLGIRAREQGVVFVICEDPEKDKRYSGYLGCVVKLTADTGRFEIMPFSGSTKVSTPLREAPVIPVSPEISDEISLIGLDRVTSRNAGGKALGLKRLRSLSLKSGSGFSVPETVVLPFGILELSLKRERGLFEEFRLKTDALDKHGIDEESLSCIREIVERIEVGISGEAEKVFGKERRLIVRSSSNSEDLDSFAGAGLYESVLNVGVGELEPALRRVYASLWSGRAVRRRALEGLRHDSVLMAVIIQEMFLPELSFVIHSVNPVTGDDRELCVEAAPGHGDTLTSLSERGRPYRALVSKMDGSIRYDSFSSFSRGVMSDKSGALSVTCIDYSEYRPQTDAEFRDDLFGRIAGTGMRIQEFFGAPQDIEGFVKGGKLYVVQSRRQTSGKPE